MTKKDYIAIARAFNARFDMAQHIQGTANRVTHYEEIATSLADVFAVDNPRFDRQRFLNACRGNWQHSRKAA